ncbi:MAG: HAMP domain-containing histidine kinase [Anaerolineales bacterium]|nr:HAMP domain-containing histidine kinase [Anaerolineales bacterium]
MRENTLKPFLTSELSKALDSPLRIAMLAWFVSVLIAEALTYFFTQSFNLTTFVVTSVTSIIVTYFISDAIISYRQTIEEKNRQLQRLYFDLQTANQQLKNQNQELDAFAHTVAHDLRTPLSIVMGHGALLSKAWQTRPPEKVSEELVVITDTAKKMSNIVDDLLLLSSLRAEGEVTVIPLNMEYVIKEALRRLDYMVASYDADIHIANSLPAACGYQPWLEEIWVNFLSNAIKYGGRPPQIEIGANLAEDNMVRFWIKDNGPGLSAAEQQNLFRPYALMTPNNSDGYGLGLSIVKRIINRLGGDVGIESHPGQGSKFFFTLPGNAKSR